ncbi:MAG TPA: glycine oxidase ThiO [Blastocatellia bacterium]|nr:glycine oxidase ThiO [Blastocatellia bacterium]
MKKDVIVIGGGVIGCSIALRLARAGLTVALFERGRVGCEASRAAAGMLSPQIEAAGRSPFLDLRLRSRSMYPDYAAALTEASGIDVEYRDEGTLCVALSDEDAREVGAWASWQVDAGLALERVSADSIRKLEPAVTETAAGAVFIPDDHQVENRRLMDALDLAIRRAGVEVVEGEEVAGLLIERGRVTGVACGIRRFHSGAVVLAAGSWSSKLLEPVGLRIDVTPVRGQMVAVRRATAPIGSVLHSKGCYLVPRKDGRILIGATVEHAGFQKAVTVRGINSLLAAAVELVPSLGDCEVIESWSGLRPDTPDHLPVIGESGISNLLLATGHFRNGILLAPVTAELITDVLINGRAPDEINHFGVERFQEKMNDAG